MSKFLRSQTEAGQIPVRGGHFLEENLAAFDAPFFSIAHAEAMSMDPQQRGLLETSYRALENGIPSNITGPVHNMQVPVSNER